MASERNTISERHRNRFDEISILYQDYIDSFDEMSILHPDNLDEIPILQEIHIDFQESVSNLNQPDEILILHQESHIDDEIPILRQESHIDDEIPILRQERHIDDEIPILHQESHIDDEIPILHQESHIDDEIPILHLEFRTQRRGEFRAMRYGDIIRENPEEITRWSNIMEASRVVNERINSIRASNPEGRIITDTILHYASMNTIATQEFISQIYTTTKMIYKENEYFNDLNINDIFDCSICLETMPLQKIALTNCNHIYCDCCINIYLKNARNKYKPCPICRTEINLVTLSSDNDPKILSIDNDVKSSLSPHGDY
jgi:hypothetical protein